MLILVYPSKMIAAYTFSTFSTFSGLLYYVSSFQDEFGILYSIQVTHRNFSDSLVRLSCSASFFCRYPILIHAQVGFYGPFGTTIVAMEMVNILCHGVLFLSTWFCQVRKIERKQSDLTDNTFIDLQIRQDRPSIPVGVSEHVT